MTETTLLWFAGTVIVNTLTARRKDTRYFRRLVLSNVELAAAIAYLTNISPFPVWMWLLIVPTAVVFAAVQALAAVDLKYARAAKPAGCIVTGLGLLVLASSVVYLVNHFDSIVSWERGEDFLLPLILTLGFIPFLYVFGLVAAYPIKS